VQAGEPAVAVAGDKHKPEVEGLISQAVDVGKALAGAYGGDVHNQTKVQRILIY
jgi:hypothetical protein